MNNHSPPPFLLRAYLRAFGLLCILTVLLSGCATPPVKTSVETPARWAEQQRTLAQLNDWQIAGKLGVRQDDRIDSAIINNWTQEGTRFEISLSSAIFGLGATTIQGTPESIWFTRSGEDSIRSDDPEALIQQQVGWTLPVSNLLYWIKGIPAPTPADDLQFDEYGNLHQMQQAGWTIRYDQYHATSPYPLPRKIVLQRSNVRLTFIINDWNLGSASS